MEKEKLAKIRAEIERQQAGPVLLSSFRFGSVQFSSVDLSSVEFPLRSIDFALSWSSVKHKASANVNDSCGTHSDTNL